MKESKYIDPDILALRQTEELKRQIIKGIDHKLSILALDNSNMAKNKTAELNKFRDYVKSILYKKGSWKDLFQKL